MQSNREKPNKKSRKYRTERMFEKSYNLVTKGYFTKKVLDFGGKVV